VRLLAELGPVGRVEGAVGASRSAGGASRRRTNGGTIYSAARVLLAAYTLGLGGNIDLAKFFELVGA